MDKNDFNSKQLRYAEEYLKDYSSRRPQLVSVLSGKNRKMKLKMHMDSPRSDMDDWEKSWPEESQFQLNFGISSMSANHGMFRVNPLST